MTIYLPVGSILYFKVNDVWTKLSEHNRDAVSMNPIRIERVQRMSNGTLRRMWICDKKNIATSWSNLPTYSSMTVDGGMGAQDLIDFYNNEGRGTFDVKISYNGVREETATMAFSSFSATVNKRNVNMSPQKKVASITAVSGSNNVITYTASNNFVVGDNVTITGLQSSEFNVYNANILSATSSSFTVASQKLISFSATEAVSSGTHITYYAPNTLSIGDAISVTGFINTSFNLTNVVVSEATDYYFKVASTLAAASEVHSATASIFPESTQFTITSFNPGASSVVYTSAAHDLAIGDRVSISGIRSSSTITGVTEHSTPGQVKYTAANTFQEDDVICIENVIPGGYNSLKATVIEATSSYFVIENATTDKFRKGGIAKSIYNLNDVSVSAVTTNTFTVPLANASGSEVTSISAQATKSVNYNANVISDSPQPQEFWDVGFGLEEA